MASIYRVHLIVLNITNKISNRALIYNGKEPINLIWYSEFHASIRKQSSANLIIQCKRRYIGFTMYGLLCYVMSSCHDVSLYLFW